MKNSRFSWPRAKDILIGPKKRNRMRSRTTLASTRLMKCHLPFQAGSTNSTKRSLDLDDSSDSEVEHSRFKRIRLVSWKSRVSQDNNFERDANKSHTDIHLEDQPSEAVKESASEEDYSLHLEYSSESGWMGSSLASGWEYEEFCGRRYNGYLSPYLQPIDEHAMDGMDMLHQLYLNALD